MKIVARSTTRSSKSRTGNSLQLLEQAAVVQVIPTGVACSPETTIVLCAMLKGLCHMTLSPDAFSIAMRIAKAKACESGVSEKAWEEISSTVLNCWERERATNPLHKMY